MKQNEWMLSVHYHVRRGMAEKRQRATKMAGAWGSSMNGHKIAQHVRVCVSQICDVVTQDSPMRHVATQVQMCQVAFAEARKASRVRSGKLNCSLVTRIAWQGKGGVPNSCRGLKQNVAGRRSAPIGYNSTSTWQKHMQGYMPTI